MLNIFLPILFFVSLTGVFYIIFKKIHILANIPIESIESKETFFAFIKRIFKSIFSSIHPRRMKIYILVLVGNILARFRSTTEKLHKTIEVLAKDVKKKSQQEKWTHNWFLHKEKKDDDSK